MIWQMRRALLEDVEDIMEIESATFGTDAWSLEMMLDEVQNPNTFYLVAHQDGRLEGYAGLLAPPGAEQGDIQTIAVVESVRGNGLGRSMMNVMIGEARSRRVRELFLEVRADNPGAQHLYESLGFSKVSVRKKYYQPDGVDAIVMRLVLPEPTVELA